MSNQSDSDSENRSLTSRIVETLRHPLARKSYTFAAVVFFASAWLTDGQIDLYNRITLTTTLVAGGVVYLGLSLWASGVFDWLGDVGRCGVRRVRGVEIGVSRSGTVTFAIAALVVASGFVAVVTVDSPNSPIQNGLATSHNWNYTGTSHNLASNVGSGWDVHKGDDGNFYVMDTGSDEVDEYDSSWTYTGTSHSTSSQ